METIHTVFGYLAAAIMIPGLVVYLYSIAISRETKLNRSSWAIWAAIGIINLLAYSAAGEKETLWYVKMAAVNPVIIFVFSLFYGKNKWAKTDTWCVLLAIIAIILWRSTGNPVLAIVFGVSADFIGLVPIYVKLRTDPYSENALGWYLGLAASVSNVFAIKELTWANGIYNAYMVIGFMAVVRQIRYGRRALVHNQQQPKPGGI